MLRVASYENRLPAIVLKGIALNVPFYLLTHLFMQYFDSSGVGGLISLNKIQKKKGKKLELAKVSPKVLNVLKLSSLAEVFNL